MSADRANSIRTGSIVEVWDRPLGRFSGRFEVADTDPTGVRVRPLTEPTPLPTTFKPDEVRLLPGSAAQSPST